MAKLMAFCLALACKLSPLVVFLLSACPAPPDKLALQPALLANPASTVQGRAASPDIKIKLPGDHLAHPDFSVEWWYLTANLTDENGAPYAYQWTLFRFKTRDNATSWDDGQSYMAHVSLHSQNQHWFGERFARGGVGNAGLTDQPLSLFLDDWQWQADTDFGALFPSTVTSRIPHTRPGLKNPEALVTLHLSANGPFVRHGQNGFSVKSVTPPLASHYYSQPFIQVEGELRINGQERRLTGLGWFDHEWSSQLMDNNAQGWDWFSLHLDNGAKIMAFRMRLAAHADFISGSYIAQDGGVTTLTATELTLLPLDQTDLGGRRYPLTWQLNVPGLNVHLRLEASKAAQVNPGRFRYYEGALNISGSHSGTGFMELTGY